MANLNADQRIALQTSTQQSQKTASPDVTSPVHADKPQQTTPSPEQIQAVNTAASTEVLSTKVGRKRLVAEDRTNLASQVTIQQSVTKITQKQQAESQQTIESTATSIPQKVQELQNLTFSSKKSQNDVTRALQKLQSRCNHKYNRNTKRCEFCNKHRDSHVYDQ